MKRLSLLIMVIFLFGFTNLHSQIPDYVPKTGLIGWWPFNGNAKDESGNRNHGIEHNIQLTLDRNSKSNSAMFFDGKTSFVSIKNFGSEPISDSAITITGWVKTNHKIPEGESMFVCSARSNSATAFVINPDNLFICTFANSQGGFHNFYSDKSNIISDGKWHFFAMVYDGFNQKTYLDSTLIWNQYFPFDLLASGLLEFGRDNPYGRHYNGDMDDIGIWNRALSEQEVKALYDSKQNVSVIPDYVPKTGLIGWWPFNGNAQDESGNGNHGTVNGAVLTTNRYNQNNKAYFFDGKDDFISTIYSGVLENQSRTFSFWINTNSSEGQQVIGYGNQPPSGGEFNILLNQVCQGISVDIHNNYITYNYPSQFGVNTWNHVVITYNNTISDNIEGVRFYINGDLVSTSIACSNPVNKIINTLNSPIFFGKYQSGDFAYVSGKLDDIGIWDRVLDSNEIKRLYNNESSLCTYSIKESDTTICQGNTLELNASYDIHVDSIPKEGLVGWWPFNGNANDESGNGNNGIVDKAMLTFGKENSPNSAYLFNKPGSKITIPDAQILNNKSLSLSFWVKSSSDSNSKNYIYKSQLLTANHEEYAIISPSSGTLEFAVKNQSNCAPGYGWNRNNVTKTLSDDQWHHVTATYDGIFSKIYVDTLLVSELQNSLFPIDSCPGGEILFGQGWDNDANLDGKLDDIAIWNRSISHAEVKIMYKLNKPKPEPKLSSDGLVGYWPFNGNANDESGNGNHGLVKGAVLSTDRCSKNNSAFKFNRKESSFIQATRDKLDTFSFSMWFNVNSISSISPLIDAFEENWEVIINGNTLKFVQWINYSNGNNSGYNYLGSSDTIKINEWYNLTGSYSNKHLILYLDGKQIFSDTNVNLPLRDDGLFLFGESRSGSTQYFDGKIDDIAIWNRPLSDSEVVQVYNAGSCNCIDTLPEDKFTWSTGQKGRKISVSPNASTMYTLEVERDNQIDRDTIHVKVLESPTPDIFGHIKVYERQVNYSYYTQLNDSSTYEWNITGNGKISSTNGGSSILIDFKEPGYAYLTVSETNKYGCRKDTTITIRIYGITDIHESTENNQALFIYPNPMNEFTSLDVKAYLPPTSRSYITISDMLGKTLQTIELGSQDSYSEVKAPVSTEGLSNGVYMIQLHFNGNVISDKVIINR